MDYKRKYEQAMLRMNKWVEGSEIIDPKEVAEFVFPELKESEDERIRKEIIEFVKSRGGFKQEYISWLEKQGEHANFRNKIQIGDEVTRNEDGALVNLSQFKRMVKQCEQKPTDKVEPKFKVKYAGNEYNVFETKELDGVTFYGIEDEPNHIDFVKARSCKIISGYAIKENGLPYPTKHAVFSEQKSAWSEEDEKILQTLINDTEKTLFAIKQEERYDIMSGLSEIYIERLRWLKSLKERMKERRII